MDIHAVNGHTQRVTDITTYVDHLRNVRRARPRTVYAYAGQLRRMQTDIGKPLQTVTAADITQWQMSSTHLTTGTVRAYLAAIGAFMKWVVASGARLDDPTRLLDRPPAPRSRPRPIGEEDLLTAISTAAADVRIALVLAGWSSLRAAEVCDLEVPDVVLTPVPLLYVHGKGGNERVVPIGRVVVEELSRYGVPRRGVVLRRRDGLPGRVAPYRLSSLVSQHLASLEINATLHRARHRYGTFMYRASRDLRMVGDFMGHEDTKTTAGYADWDTSNAVTALAALDKTWGS